MARPSICVPFKLFIALVASSGVPNFTVPHPRERPFLSICTMAEVEPLKSCERSSPVVAHGKLLTYKEQPVKLKSSLLFPLVGSVLPRSTRTIISRPLTSVPLVPSMALWASASLLKLTMP